jgi:hypothetical protein
MRLIKMKIKYAFQHDDGSYYSWHGSADYAYGSPQHTCANIEDATLRDHKYFDGKSIPVVVTYDKLDDLKQIGAAFGVTADYLEEHGFDLGIVKMLRDKYDLLFPTNVETHD